MCFDFNADSYFMPSELSVHTTYLVLVL